MEGGGGGPDGKRGVPVPHLLMGARCCLVRGCPHHLPWGTDFLAGRMPHVPSPFVGVAHRHGSNCGKLGCVKGGHRASHAHTPSRDRQISDIIPCKMPFVNFLSEAALLLSTSSFNMGESLFLITIFLSAHVLTFNTSFHHYIFTIQFFLTHMFRYPIFFPYLHTF